MRRVMIMLAGLLLGLNAFSQKETADIGLFLGGGTPLGDYTKTYRFQSIKLDYGAFYRYNFSSRLAVRINALSGTIGASGEMNGLEALSYSKTVTEASALLEINYLDFIMGLDNRRLSPFIFAGIGLSYYNGPLDAAVISPSVPVGFGIKYALTKHWGVGAELSVHKLFDDRLDNIVDPYRVSGMVPVTDFWHNNDWIIYGGVKLWYRFYVGKRECPAYDSLNE